MMNAAKNIGNTYIVRSVQQKIKWINPSSETELNKIN